MKKSLLFIFVLLLSIAFAKIPAEPVNLWGLKGTFKTPSKHGATYAKIPMYSTFHELRKLGLFPDASVGGCDITYTSDEYITHKNPNRIIQIELDCDTKNDILLAQKIYDKFSKKYNYIGKRELKETTISAGNRLAYLERLSNAGYLTGDDLSAYNNSDITPSKTTETHYFFKNKDGRYKDTISLNVKTVFKNHKLYITPKIMYISPELQNLYDIEEKKEKKAKLKSNNEVDSF